MRLPAGARSARASSRTSRISLTPVATAEYDEEERGRLRRDQPREGRLPDARRPPEDERRHAVLGDRPRAGTRWRRRPRAGPRPRRASAAASGRRAGRRAKPRTGLPGRSSRSKRRPLTDAASRSRRHSSEQTAIVSPPRAPGARACGRSRCRRPGPAPSRPRPTAPRTSTATSRATAAAPRSTPRSRKRAKRGGEPDHEARRAEIALLDPIEVGNLGVPPLELVEQALRRRGVVQIEGLNRGPGSGATASGSVGLPRAAEERRRPAELAAVAVRGSQVREQVRVLRRLAPRLLVGRDGAIPVVLVVPDVAELDQEPGSRGRGRRRAGSPPRERRDSRRRLPTRPCRPGRRPVRRPPQSIRR